MLWHMGANGKYNCLQFAQQLIAYGLLIKTDESILTYTVKLFTTSQSIFIVQAITFKTIHSIIKNWCARMYIPWISDIDIVYNVC